MDGDRPRVRGVRDRLPGQGQEGAAVISTFASQVVTDPGGDVLVAQNIAFGIIAAMMIFGAFRVVTTKNVVHAALYLVIVLAGVAAQFLLLGAEFIGITQVLVYIGAI